MYAVLSILVLVLCAWYLSFSASRLDRLHHREETSWEHLDSLLQRRAALALEISHSSHLDPATHFILTESAYVTREDSVVDRSDAELALSNSLDFLIGASKAGEVDIELSLLNELAALTDKISIAIAVHLEAISAVSKRRSKFIYRFFRLAGRAKLPTPYSFEEHSKKI